MVMAGLLLTACSAAVPAKLAKPQTQEQNVGVTIAETQQTTTPETQQPTQQATAGQTQETTTLTLRDYKKWMLSAAIIEENIADWENWGEQDCYGLMNGVNGGGDLLSTLIADNDTRAKLDLKAYTPEYVMALEKKIVGYTHRQYSNDFYAISVCHLGKGIDAVTGILWPQGKAMPTQPYGTHLSKDALIIVNNNDVMSYEDIQTLNNTATGAEVYPCSGKIEKQNVLWSCFQGLHIDKDNVTGANMAEWKIPLDGGKITKREYVE